MENVEGSSEPAIEDAAPGTPTSSLGASDRIALRRLALDWRDSWQTQVELVLKREARSLAIDLQDVEGGRGPLSWFMSDDAHKAKITDTVDLWMAEVQATLPDPAMRELRYAVRGEHFAALPDGMAEILGRRLVLADSASGRMLRGLAARSTAWRDLSPIICGRGDGLVTSLSALITDHLEKVCSCMLELCQ